MTVDVHTGEIVEFDQAAAERRAERINLRLDAIADNYRAVLPMIREAIEKRDDAALGYRSVGEYVQDRFGGALANLGVDVRRAVVGELTDAGMSTRAIAPVVGVSNYTVSKDQEAVRDLTPDPQTPEPNSEGEADAGSGQAPQVEREERPETPSPRPAVTGIDGKTYNRPSPKLPPAPPLRTPEQQNAEEFCERFAGHIVSLQSMQYDHMRAAAVRDWGRGSVGASPVQRAYVDAEHIRIAAEGLMALADEWNDA